MTAGHTSCLDCQHFLRIEAAGLLTEECTHPKSAVVADGAARFRPCSDMRDDSHATQEICGQEARWFEAKAI